MSRNPRLLKKLRHDQFQAARTVDKGRDGLEGWRLGFRALGFRLSGFRVQGAGEAKNGKGETEMKQFLDLVKARGERGWEFLLGVITRLFVLSNGPASRVGAILPHNLDVYVFYYVILFCCLLQYGRPTVQQHWVYQASYAKQRIFVRAACYPVAVHRKSAKMRRHSESRA